MMDWRKFFVVTIQHLDLSPGPAPGPRSWCSWTTFDRLAVDAGYWTAPVLTEDALGSEGTKDFGHWRQPFPYSSLAHFILPRTFHWEKNDSREYIFTNHDQDIVGLAEKLQCNNIDCHLSGIALEIKLF
jgi:hypothetical protein